MSKIVVNLSETAEKNQNKALLESYQKSPKRSVFMKVLGTIAVVLAIILLIGGVFSYFYWQHIKTQPQYSLALLVDAARRDDAEAVEQFVDTEAVIQNFMPQITGQAVELYGKGLPKETLARVAKLAAPFIPAIKQRAKAELPRVIRDKTQKFEDVPYWMIALGADKVVEIKRDGETAQIISNNPERPLELTMKRQGERWQIVGIKDEQLAKKIAQTFGQQLMQAATKGDLRSIGEQFGVKGLEDILKKAQDIFK